MKKRILVQALTAAFLLPAQIVWASDVTGLTTFSAGTPAVASQVNGNFTAVKSAVDNNHARITTLESGAASPNITGNITLPNSTATAGNITKNGTPFLHNFGNGNTFLGLGAGNFTMTGGYNTASGERSLLGNTTGNYNTASGSLALFGNTTGHHGTAIGSHALRSNTSGYANTAIGSEALMNNTTGGSNIAVGLGALSNNITGNGNTAIGGSALAYATGIYNIGIGSSAGLSLTTGDYNIYIGSGGITGDSSTIRIGDVQTRAFINGIRGVTTGFANAVAVVVDSYGQLGTLSSSQRVKDDIADMGDTSSVLKQLRPVTFHYKSDHNAKGRSLQYGLIAEEVAKVAPGLVARSANGEIETVFYQHLAPMLLNEFQKQQRVIEAQTAALAKQTERLAQLEQERHLQTARIEMLEKQAALMTMALGRMERAGLLTAAGRW